MRKLALLPLLALLASCGSEPEPVPIWRNPEWKRVDAACERFPDWSDGLSLEELLACVDRRGAVQVAREITERAALRKEATRTFPSFPFEVSGVRPARREDRVNSGAMVRHVFDYNLRWEKLQESLTAEIALDRGIQEDLRGRVREFAGCAYWCAVAAEGRLAIAREEATALRPVEIRDRRSGPEIVLGAGAGADDDVRLAEQDAAAAREEVAALAGGDVPDSWWLSDSFPEDRPEVDLDRAIAAARGHRTRLAALAAAAVEARCRLDRAEAEAAPDPGIGVSYSIERYRNTNTFDFHNSESSAFIGFFITIPNHAQGRGAIASTTSETRASLQARNEAEAEVVPIVTEAVARYRDARGRLAHPEEALPPAPRPGTLPGGNVLSLKRAVIGAQLEFAIARSRLEAAVGLPVAEYSR